ncbi:hypothetical protein [Georgenia sp. AZ-5]|uniref:hypothetical protein n=1 Tax=Georgenia sp. AZ-5 TaxID=3367526 RepID=UPI003754AE5C
MPYDKDTIKDAPRADDDGHLDLAKDEAALPLLRREGRLHASGIGELATDTTDVGSSEREGWHSGRGITAGGMGHHADNPSRSSVTSP